MGCNPYIRQKLPVDDASGFSGQLVLGNTRIDLTTGDITNWTGSGVISGFVGFSSTSGFSGFSGEGFSGPSGPSGFSGVGFSGPSGPSGFSGFSGPSGLGESGTSGYSGDPGQPGQSGESGYSGFSGTYSGFSGFSGPSGFSGTSGDSGASGFSGQMGTGIQEIQLENAYPNPAYASPTPDKVGRFDVLLFHAAVLNAIDSSFEIPEDLVVGNDLFLILDYDMSTAQAGTVRLVLS